jgi:WD40 repeat protein
MEPTQSPLCPTCQSGKVLFHEDHLLFSCSVCGHVWGSGAYRGGRGIAKNVRVAMVFLPNESAALAAKLEVRLTEAGYDVLLSGNPDNPDPTGARDSKPDTAQVVLAILAPETPSAGAECSYASCSEELASLRAVRPRKPVIPVLAANCEPPACLHRLRPVDMHAWRRSPEDFAAGFARLTDAIEAALVGETRLNPWEQRLKSFDFNPFIDTFRDGFVGREWLFGEYEHWLSGRTEPVFLVSGEPGSGKSAFAAELCHRDPGGHILAAHFCLAGMPETLRPERFIQHVAAVLASRLPVYAAQIEEPAQKEAFSKAHEDPKSVFANGVLAALEKPGPPGGRPQVILVDGLDEALLLDRGLPIPDLLTATAHLFPKWLRFAATARPDHSIRSRFQGTAVHEAFISGPRNLADLVFFAGQRLKAPPLADMLALSGMAAADTVGVLSGKSEGSFLYVAQALEETARGRLEAEAVETLPPGIMGLYNVFFSRRFPNIRDYHLARPLFQVLAAAREPLPESVLAKALDMDPRQELLPLRRQAHPLVQEMPGWDDGPCFRLLHPTLANWLADELLAGSYLAGTRGGHARLAVFCLEEIRKKRPHPYALEHGVAHLVQAGRLDEVESLLPDLGYMDKKLKTAGARGLIRDTTLLPAERAGKKGPLACREFAEKYAYELTVHPGLLPGLALNEPQDSPVRQEAERLAQGGKWPGSLYFGVTGLLSPPEPDPAFWSVRLPDMPTCMDAGLTASRTLAGCYGGTVWMLYPGRRDLLRLPYTHKAPVESVVLLENEERGCSLDRSGCAVFWDTATGRVLDILQLDSNDGAHVTFVPGHGLWAFGGPDGTIRLYDPGSGEVIRSIAAHTRGVRGLGSYGYTLVSAGGDNRVCFWEAGTGTLTQKGSFPDKRIQNLFVRASGQSAATSMSRVFLLPQAGARLVTLDSPDPKANMRVVSCDFEGGVVAVGCSDGHVYARGPGDRDWHRQFQLPGGAVCALSVSAGGTRLAAGGRDGTARVGRIERGAFTENSEPGPGITGVLVDARGAYAICLTGQRRAGCHSLDGQETPSWTPMDYLDWTGAYTSVERPFSLVCGARERVICWNPATQESMAMGQGHGALVVAVLAVNDRLVASSGRDNALRAWDRYEGRLVQELLDLPAPCGLLTAAGAEGPVAAAVGGDVWVWEPGAIGKKPLVIPGGGAGRVTAMAPLPGGHGFALGYENGLVRSFQGKGFTRAAEAKLHKWPVTRLCHNTPDMLFSVGADGRSVLWEITDGKTWDFAQGTRVMDIRQGPGQGRWTTLCFDGFLHVWEAYERAASWRVGTEAVFACSRDNRIVVGTREGALFTLSLRR